MISPSLLKKRTLYLLAAAGLVIRLAGGFAKGSQDMDFWKAYAVFCVQHDVKDIYGSADEVFVRLWRSGKTAKEIQAATQTVIPYQSPVSGTVRIYTFPQPPGYIYSIYLSALAMSWLDPSFKNDRLFNFVLNLEPLLSSLAIALFLFWFVGKLTDPGTGAAAGLVYWLNPVVFLNAPIQGFRDPLCALFILLAVCALHQKKLTIAYVCAVACFMTKPQGVVVAPLILCVGLAEHNWRRNAAAFLAACAAGVALCLPFILQGRFLSLLQGVATTMGTSNDLSRQAMNIWWPVQYVLNAAELVRSGVPAWAAWLGRDWRVFTPYPIARITEATGVNLRLVATGLFALFTAANIYWCLRAIRADRNRLFLFAALQAYGYFMLAGSVHNNHYFILVPLLTAACAFKVIPEKYYAAVCLVFFLQDGLFYGLGRDSFFGLRRDNNYLTLILSHLYLSWTTLLLAFANLALFAGLCRRAFSRGPAASR
ncbi:MAG: hypothetical protein PHV36_08085 [Elusimicrobiales bacterium]|nr:hypothetical protein [Elusimicrobiales bacterium]